MQMIRIQDILHEKILVSRESARKLQSHIMQQIESITQHEEANSESSIILDFEGVEGMTPSFLDELLRVFESVVFGDSDRVGAELIVRNPPSRMSTKFEAVARSHDISIRILDDTSWLLMHKAGTPNP